MVGVSASRSDRPGALFRNFFVARRLRGAAPRPPHASILRKTAPAILPANSVHWYQSGSGEYAALPPLSWDASVECDDLPAQIETRVSLLAVTEARVLAAEIGLAKMVKFCL